MKDFIGLARDTVASKNPTGTWQNAKNILLTKGYKSITNEDGFSFEYLVPGTVIGIIETNKEVVFFTKDTLTGISEIGIVNLGDNAPVYRTVIKSALLNFQLNCPIEGIFVYNFKEEPIVSWCDGVYTNSNPPRVVNLTTLPFAVNPDGTLVTPSDIYLINLNPNLQQGTINLSKANFGTFSGYAIYVTFSYVFNDDTLVGYFPVSNLFYAGKDYDPITQFGLKIELLHLDKAFTRLKIGLIIKTESTEDTQGTLVGYESPIYEYNQGAAWGSVDFVNTLTSLDGFTEINPAALLIEKAYFSKVGTMTKQENQAIIGNVETKPILPFQKYANLINIIPIEYLEEESQYQNNTNEHLASFLPDEVYSFYIELQLLDGSYTPAYHIPGRVAQGTERDLITPADRTANNIQWTTVYPWTRQFHIFNNGIAASMSRPAGSNTNPRPSATSESIINKMGYWENTETYPDSEDYDSTVDYNGNALSGTDMRNTPIRYHRMPSIYTMALQTKNPAGGSIPDPNLLQPFRAGSLGSPDTSNQIWGLGGSYKYEEVNGVQIPDVSNNRMRKLGIRITNFDQIVPAFIKDQIQAYRISHVVRNSVNSYVAGNWIAIPRRDPNDNPGNYNVGDDSYEQYDFFGETVFFVATRFNKLRVLGAELMKFKPSLSPVYIQANYVTHSSIYDIKANNSGNASIGDIQNAKHRRYISSEVTVPPNKRFAGCTTALEYRPGNSITNDTEYTMGGVNLDVDDSGFMRMYAQYHYPTNAQENSYAEIPPPNVSGDNFYELLVAALNITAYHHNKDVYAGFKTSQLNIVGRTIVGTNIKVGAPSSTVLGNVDFKRGDNFTSSRFQFWTRSLHKYTIGYFLITNGPYSGKVAYRPESHNVFIPICIYGLNSPVNDALVYNTKGEYFYPAQNADQENTALYPTFDYEFSIQGIEGINSIQNILAILTFNTSIDFINRFPYRVYKGLKIPNENLTLTALSTYKVGDYYEMPNDKGEIIAVRGSEGYLYIQHRFTLFVAAIKDTIKTEDIEAYLGRSDLFSRPPKEIISDDKGYIGSVSKFASKVIKGMYITVSQSTGQIFMIQGLQAMEISALGNKQWFWNNWDNGLDFYYLDDNGEKNRIDNPYVSVGHLVTYDKQYDRLIFTKRMVECIGNMNGLNFDGEFYRNVNNSSDRTIRDFRNSLYFINKSITLSFNLQDNQYKWVCGHDYTPNIYFYSINKLYSVYNRLVNLSTIPPTAVYQHNTKVNKGTFYDDTSVATDTEFTKTYESYVDLIFNTQSDMSKLLMNISWITDVLNTNRGIEINKTITHIMIYNQHQCSGIINLKDNHYTLTRDVEGSWNFNDFRDATINPSNPVLNEDGSLDINNINNNKLWFEKSNFISKFVIVRLIMDNVDNDTVYINEVSVKSLISKR